MFLLANFTVMQENRERSNFLSYFFLLLLYMLNTRLLFAHDIKREEEYAPESMFISIMQRTE